MAKGNVQLHEANRTFTRAGEGTPVSVAITHSVGANGMTEISMSIQLAEAPVPDRRYAADFVSIVYKDDVVKLIFGQEKLSSTEVRSCVVVALNLHDASLLLKTIEDMANPSLDEIFQASHATVVPKIREIKEEPAQTIALSANFVLAASSGRSSCMDFYSVSAFAFAETQKTKKVPVDPVVRIDLSTANLIALRDELLRLKPTFAA
jgi:hypothetical protein